MSDNYTLGIQQILDQLMSRESFNSKEKYVNYAC